MYLLFVHRVHIRSNERFTHGYGARSAFLVAVGQEILHSVVLVVSWDGYTTLNINVGTLLLMQPPYCCVGVLPAEAGLLKNTAVGQ